MPFNTAGTFVEMNEAKRATERSQSLFTCSECCCVPMSLKFCVQEIPEGS